jgi:hypothetical protein
MSTAPTDVIADFLAHTSHDQVEDAANRLVADNAAARPRHAGTSFESQAPQGAGTGSESQACRGPLNATSQAHCHPGQARNAYLQLECLFVPAGTAARRRPVTGWRATIIRGLDGERSVAGQRVRIGHCRRVTVRQDRGAGDGAAAAATRSGVAGVPRCGRR